MTKSQLRHARKHCYRDGLKLADMVAKAGAADSYVSLAEARTLSNEELDSYAWEPVAIEPRHRANKNTARRRDSRARRHAEQVADLDRQIVANALGTFLDEIGAAIEEDNR